MFYLKVPYLLYSPPTPKMHKLLYMLGGIELLSNKILVANYGDNSLSIIDRKDLSLVGTVCLRGLLDGKTGFTRLLVENESRVLILDSDHDCLYRIDISKHKHLGQADLGRCPIRIKGFENRIYVLNIDSNSLSIIDKSDLNIIENVYLGEKPTDLAIDPATGDSYITNLNSHCLSVVNHENGEIDTIKLSYMPFRIKIKDDSIYVLGFLNNHTLSCSIISSIDIKDKLVIWEEILKGIYFDFEKSKEQDIFYLVDSENSWLYEYDKSTRENQRKLYIGGLTNYIIYDFENLYLNDMINNQLVIVDIASNQIKKRITVGREPHDILLT